VPSILVVDDALTDRALVGGLLTKSIDCTVLEADDGKAALSQIELHQPDLVLTDLDMPNLNGLELVAAIKEDHPLIPVILMTAKGSEEIAALALQQGAASYVPKRRLAEDLVETVERVLKTSRENRVHVQLMHYLTESECTFNLHNDLALIQSLVSYLLQMLRCLPLGDETERLRVGIALEEALLNAFYHGNLELGAEFGHLERTKYNEIASQRLLQKPYRDRKIQIRTNISRDKAVFVVRDDGPGFDSQALTSANSDIATQTAGRGLRLMQAIMDDVSFNETGNEVTMLKLRVHEEIDDTPED